MWEYLVVSGLTIAVAFLWFKAREHLQSLHEAELKIVELQMAQSSDTMEAMLSDYLMEIGNLRNTNQEMETEIGVLNEDVESMTTEMKKQKGRAASAHTQRGLLLEKWCPFLQHDEIDPAWDSKDWSFLGQPIDYLVFNWYQDTKENLENGIIVMLDVKSGKSSLTTKQRRIRDLVKAGKVEWREIRLD